MPATSSSCMNVLYVGTNRADKDAVAAALRGASETVEVAWVQRLEQVGAVLDSAPELAALVVDAPVDRSGWHPLLARVRHLRSHPVVVVIAGEGTGPLFESLDLDADEILAKSQAFRELPAAIRRAAGRRALRSDRGPALTPDAHGELERLLARAIQDLKDAEARHRSAMAAAEQRLAKERAQHEISSARSAATWEMVDEQLREAAARVEQSRRDQASAAAEVERLSRRESELSSLVAAAAETRLDLERRLAVAGTAHTDAMARAADERRAAGDEAAERRRHLEAALAEARADLDARAADLERLAARQAELTAELAEAAEHRATLEHRLEATEAAFEDATGRATRERLAAATRAAEREAELGAELQQARAACAALEQAASDARAALRAATERHDEASAASAQELADRNAAYTRELTEAAAARDDLARRLSEVQAVLDRVRCEYESAAADVERLTRRESNLALELAKVQATSDTLKVRLAEETDTLRARALDQTTRLEARLADERFNRDLERSELEERHRELERDREALGDSLSAVSEQLRDLEGAHRDACERFERDRASADADIQRLTAERAAAERALAEARHDFERAINRASNERAAAEQASEAARAGLQQQLHDAQAALEAAKGRAAAMEADIDSVSLLRNELDDSRAENRRFFQQVPLPLFRCSRDGAIIDANRAWMILVRRRASELSGPDVPATLFESPADLPWLIERCVTAAATESVETIVRRRDGVRIAVRLSASPLPGDIVEVAAEDLTRLRVLQERLGQSHRMEAVGRVASEVALTCTRLIHDVQQDVQEWIRNAGTVARSPQQAELLLDGLTRATAALRQLVAYHDEQAGAPSVVDLIALLHDLTPVLKRVAGDEVDIRVGAPTSPVHVDADAERVERLFVNLASYGRDRMPSGSRLAIDVATTQVDHPFTARYPNVRPGPHALITVRETRPTARSGVIFGRRDVQAPDDGRGAAVKKPGVDLQTLQGLVGDCGGHLWMKVQPLGDIVAKIRLPLLISYDQSPITPVPTRGRAGTAIARLFQH